MNTARQYETSLRSFAKANGGRRWSDIKADDIVIYLANKKAAGASNNTIIANISAIRGLYNWMMIQYKLAENPAKYLISPKKIRLSLIPSMPRTSSRQWSRNHEKTSS